MKNMSSGHVSWNFMETGDTFFSPQQSPILKTPNEIAGSV